MANKNGVRQAKSGGAPFFILGLQQTYSDKGKID